MLTDDITRYVELHRSLGFKFRTQALLLRSFAVFAERKSERFVSISSVLQWAGQAPSSEQRRNRLLAVRRFALAARAEDARHQVPPRTAFGNRSFRRRTPHIYTAAEIEKLMEAAGELSPGGSIRPLAYVTLLGLIAATGVRVSEALCLQLEDVTTDGLLVRETKFHKSRLVPLHKTVCQALDRYLIVRERVGTSEHALFVSLRGTAMNYNTVSKVFRELTRVAGLLEQPCDRLPRIHDLRHTFAVRSIEQCASNPESVKRHIAALSTYLGHAHVTDTYWYLQATPKLMVQVASAGEALYTGDIQ